MANKTENSIEEQRKADLENLPVWDLSEYYDSIEDPRIEQDLQKSKELAQAFAEKYKGRVAELSGDELAIALEEEEQLDYLASKPILLGSYLSTQDGADSKISAFQQSVSERVNEISQYTQFLGLELKKIDDADMEATIAGSEHLQQYAPLIERVRQFRDHTLSDEIEEHELKKDPVDVTDVLNKMLDKARVKMRHDFRGESLTSIDLDEHIESEDRETRKEAMQARAAAHSDWIDLPVDVMNNIIKAKQIEDEIRGYEGDMGRRNKSNNVEEDVVNALLDAVISEYEGTSQKYNELFAQMMGLEGELAEWDLRADLPDKSKKYISWDEAKELVLESYREFSPQMADIAEKFFDEGWIDAKPREGKRGGAYSSSGLAQHHPHVHMNYTGSPRDVMTLAHELGHGIHQYLENETHGNITPGTPLTLAETASIFGEELVFNKLIDGIDDPTERKVLLAEKVSDEIGTIVRQASWVDFERKIHAKRREGELSQEDFQDAWREVNTDREGPAVTAYSEGWEDSWSRVPHMFHTPFYMYAYSFGNLMVNSLFEAHKEGEIDNFEDKYIEMLKTGGRKHHSELLEPFGFDLSDPEFWKKGMNVLKGHISQLEQAIAEEKALKESLQPANDDTLVELDSIEVTGAGIAEEKQKARGRG